MKKKLYLILILIFSNNILAEMDANEIIKKADLKRGLGNISHSFIVTINNNGDSKVEVYKVRFKDLNNSLIEQTEPERARGRKILMKDNDMWLFTPNIKKPLRISLDQKLTGEVANGDIANTNYTNDYDAKIIKTEKIANREIYKLELIAKNKKVTYGKIEYSVDKKDFTPLDATFFAISGKPLKKALFQDFKVIKGSMRASKMVIQDYLNKSKISNMVFSEHNPENFEESIFNKDRLEF